MNFLLLLTAWLNYIRKDEPVWFWLCSLTVVLFLIFAFVPTAVTLLAIVALLWLVDAMGLLGLESPPDTETLDQ